MLTSMELKEQIHKLVDSLPEDDALAIEEMHYRLYVLEKIQKGMTQLDQGKAVTDEDARRQLSKWLCD